MCVRKLLKSMEMIIKLWYTYSQLATRRPLLTELHLIVFFDEISLICVTDIFFNSNLKLCFVASKWQKITEICKSSSFSSALLVLEMGLNRTIEITLQCYTAVL